MLHKLCIILVPSLQVHSPNALPQTAPLPLFNMAKRARQPVQASPFEMQTPPTLATTPTLSYCPYNAAPLPQGGGQSWGRHNTPSPMETSWANRPFGQHCGKGSHPHPPPAPPQSDPLRAGFYPAAPAGPSTRDQVTAPKVGRLMVP